MKIQNSTVKTNLIETGSSSKTRPSQAKKKEPSRRGFLKLMMAAPFAASPLAAAGCKTYAQPKPGDGSLAKEAEISKEEAAEKIQEAKLKYTKALAEIREEIRILKPEIVKLKQLSTQDLGFLDFDFASMLKVLASQKDLASEMALERYIAIKEPYKSLISLEDKLSAATRLSLDTKRKTIKEKDYDSPEYKKEAKISDLFFSISSKLSNVNFAYFDIIFSLVNETTALQNSSVKFGEDWHRHFETYDSILGDLDKIRKN